nr:hypothetical protein GCM10025732_12540 [Glycomyces mayteni]
MAQPMSATARPAGPSETPLTPLSGMPKRIGREIVMLLMGGVGVFCFQLTIDMALAGETTTVTFMLPILIFIVSMCAWTAVKFLAPTRTRCSCRSPRSSPGSASSTSAASTGPR